MKLIDLLREEVTHKLELSELKFLEMLKEKARNSHNVMKHMPIFKEDYGSDFMLVTPAEKEIRSSFWIDKMLKSIQTWAKFPSRTRCLKGYTSIDRLGGQDSDQYVVIPLDRSKIGICPTDSFYRSFENVQKSMNIVRVDNDGLSDWIETVAKGISNLFSESKIVIHSPESYTDFIKMLKDIDKELKENKTKLKKLLHDSENLVDKEKKILTDLFDRHITTCEMYLAEKFDPDQNKFNCSRVESLNAVGNDREVWISDPCLLIKRNKYIEMYKNGSIK